MKWTEIENSLLLDSFYRKELIKTLQSKNELITLEASSRFSMIDRKYFHNKLKLLLMTDLYVMKLYRQVDFDGFLLKNNDEINREVIAKNFNNNNVEYFKLERKNKLEYDYFFASQPYGQETLESFINSLQVLEKKRIIFRKHPRDKYIYKFKEKVSIDNASDPLDTISRSNIVIGLTSTILTDAIVLGKTAISLNIDERTKCHNSTYPNKNILMIERPSELLEIYNTNNKISKKTLNV